MLMAACSMVGKDDLPKILGSLVYNFEHS